MRVPISWLKEYVDIDLSVAKTAEILTNAGLEVKTIEYIGLPGADLEWEDDKLVLGHILKVEQHPDADRLVLATVEYGASEPEIVVTGAPNLFQYLGQGDISDYAASITNAWCAPKKSWESAKNMKVSFSSKKIATHPIMWLAHPSHKSWAMPFWI
jgi:hypothetical protein